MQHAWAYVPFQLSTQEIKIGDDLAQVSYKVSGGTSEVFTGRNNFLGDLRDKPGESNGTPLQYSCLENPMDRGAW